tara:strand:- start:101 stop:472 length:372 start_codon:yes stop_codon:yes gene_type:complete
MLDREVLWSRTKDLLVIIVIPAAIWITSSIFSMKEAVRINSSSYKVQSERVTRLESQAQDVVVKLVKLESVQKDLDSLTVTINALSTKDNTLEVKVTRLESKIESMGDDIKDIKTMVKQLVKN